MEIMIVVIIISILVSLAFPFYYRSVERSRMNEAYYHLSAIRNAELAYYTKYLTYADNLLDLTADNPNDLPLRNRYFDYNEDILTIPTGIGSGFVAACTRNNTNNILSFSYYVNINQDGIISTNFYQ